ncbi:MAG TPA: NADH-quinone oxidoreductase subunit C [Gemmatimonadales bacterium]|nr:NADH-quinone oxidoreductase subunit C [Gemmatimonadales bacterium]
MTREWTGTEAAAAAERLVPGSVDKTTATACYLKPEKLVETFQALRTDSETDFVHLTNLCGVDWWDRMEVVYHVQSFDRNQLAVFKCETWDRENPVVPSLTPVYHGAWMQENEAYDMFGIKFEGHPNLYRIMLWEGFPGWPLRKDFLSMPGGLQPGLNEFAGVSRRPEPPVRVVERDD